jgi:glycosyltransferase involved in cell wall biosynthesis/multidrug transporter EmrE-like cation transporter
MKILMITPYPPRRDGIAVYARGLAGALRTEGNEVTVLCPPDGDGDMRVPFYGGRPFVRAARLARHAELVLVQFQPTLYYRPRRPVSKVLSSLGLLWLALRMRWRRGRLLDVVVHEADPPVRWRPDYLLLGLALRLAGRLSFHTDAERRSFERAYGFRVREVRLVPQVAAGVTCASREAARKELGIENGAGPVFVCAGFLQPSKGFDRAVAAFAAAVANGMSDARLYVVGSVREPIPENLAYADDLRAACDRIPGAHLVDEFVSDAGFDLWLSAADRVVLPYRRSWSSGVLARAHAVGRPAIVAAVGGLPEQAGEHDIVVHDDDELQRAMRGAGGSTTDHATVVATPEAYPHAVPESVSDWDPELHPPLPTKGRTMLFGLILVSVLLAALAQLTLKHGMTQVTHRGDVPLAFTDPVQTFRRIGSNLSVLLGLGTFVLSAAVWLLVLSKVSLSFAYPFVSLTYVLILVFDRLVLHENVSGLRWAGVAFIVAGILLVSRTHQAS